MAPLASQGSSRLWPLCFPSRSLTSGERSPKEAAFLNTRRTLPLRASSFSNQAFCVGPVLRFGSVLRPEGELRTPIWANRLLVEKQPPRCKRQDLQIQQHGPVVHI